MKIRRSLAAAVAMTGALLLAPGLASAHHTTVSCQSPGVWLIVNSESDKSMTFTTDQGHAGSIPGGGSTTVAYSGTSLTVFGEWENGVEHTDTGSGDCTVPTTTTTVPATTTTEVTTSTSTTLATTTTTDAPTTTGMALATTVPVSTSTVDSSTSSTTTEPTSLTSSSTTVLAPTTTAPSSTTPPTSNPAPPAEPPSLPATGADADQIAAWALELVAVGFALMIIAKVAR